MPKSLRPRPAEIHHMGEVFTLKPFSLSAQIWAADEFATEAQPNGLISLAARFIENDWKVFVKVGWQLLDKRGKKHFEHNFESWADSFDVESAFKVLTPAINATVGNSNPDITDDTAELDELKKRGAVAMQAL